MLLRKKYTNSTLKNQHKMIILLPENLVLSSSLCRELDAATISLFCGARPPQHPFLSFITLFILRYTHWQKSICIWRHLCIFAWLTRTFIYKTSWVASLVAKILGPNIRYFVELYIKIWCDLRTFWKSLGKKAPF